MRISGACALVFGTVLLAPSATLAQGANQDRNGGSDGIEGFVSVGAGLIPDYEGSKHYEATPYFDLRLNMGNYYARFEGGALRFNLLDSEHIHAGPLLGFRRGRGDSDAFRVRRMRHIRDSATVGGFLEYENVHQDPRAGERVTLMADDDVTGDDSGWQITLRGVIRRPLDFIDRGMIASLEADADWASQNYMQTYFDVTTPDAVRSGLPGYGASAGFKSVGAAVSLDQFLSRHWSVGVRFHYARLMNSAADSPVTAIAGSPNQYFAALVVGYAL